MALLLLAGHRVAIDPGPDPVDPDLLIGADGKPHHDIGPAFRVIAHESHPAAPFGEMAQTGLLQRGNRAANQVETLDVAIERVALRLGDARLAQVIAEIGPSGLMQGVALAFDILGRALHELDFFAEIQTGDPAHGPDEVVGRGGHPLLALEAVFEVVVRTDVVVLQKGHELRHVAVDPVHAEDLGGAGIGALADGVAEGREEAEIQLREARVAAGLRILGVMANTRVPPGSDLRGTVVAAAEIAPAVALHQILAEHEEAGFVRLPGVDVFEQVVALDMLDRVDAQRIHTHVQIPIDGPDQIVLDVLALGGQVDAVPGQVLVLERMGALPVAAADEALLVVPLGVQIIGVDTEETPGIVAGLGHRLAGLGIDQRLDTLRIAVVALAVPFGCDRVVDVVAIRPGVIAEMTLVGAMIDLPLLRALRHVIFDRQMVDVHLPPDAVLAGVVHDDVLDDLDALGVGGVDQVLIGRSG